MEKDCGAQINLLSRMLKRRLNVTLQGLGITAIQSRVMFYIMDHCPAGPVFQRDVEQAFSLSRSTATGILQQLEEKDLLRRESVPSDARLKNLVPTPRAAELDAEVRACLRQSEAVLTRGLSVRTGPAVQGDAGHDGRQPGAGRDRRPLSAPKAPCAQKSS